MADSAGCRNEVRDGSVRRFRRAVIGWSWQLCLGRRESRRGILLPVVLLVILALGAVSVSVLVLVSTQRLVARGELAYLEDRIRAEALMVGLDEGVAIEGFSLTEVELLGAFSLVGVAPANRGLSYFSVRWVLNPDSITAGLPGALELVGSAPEVGVQPLEGCSSMGARPLVVTLSHDASSPSATQGPGTPRVGLLGVSELLELAESELPEPAVLPGAAPAAVRRASAGTVILGGQGTGVLIAVGDLTLEGSTQFSGLLIVEGALTLLGSARVEGVVLAGGSVRISGDAAIFGCPDTARAGLELPALNRGHPLPEGWLLGRY